jgi:hypothetical protein
VKNFCCAQKINIPAANHLKEKGARQKLEQLKKLYDRKKERRLYKQGVTKMDKRKARVRTLIQLGGLVFKAGLLEPLDLALGDDLQKDEQNFDGVATLMGGFLDLSAPLYHDEAQKILWRERGKKALAN